MGVSRKRRTGRQDIYKVNSCMPTLTVLKMCLNGALDLLKNNHKSLDRGLIFIFLGLN